MASTLSVRTGSLSPLERLSQDSTRRDWASVPREHTTAGSIWRRPVRMRATAYVGRACHLVSMPCRPSLHGQPSVFPFLIGCCLRYSCVRQLQGGHRSAKLIPPLPFLKPPCRGLHVSLILPCRELLRKGFGIWKRRLRLIHECECSSGPPPYLPRRSGALFRSH